MAITDSLPDSAATKEEPDAEPDAGTRNGKPDEFCTNCTASKDGRICSRG